MYLPTISATCCAACNFLLAQQRKWRRVAVNMIYFGDLNIQPTLNNSYNIYTL